MAKRNINEKAITLTAAQLKQLEKSRTEIREDLLCQLDANGTTQKCYVDMIDDYMAMWDTKNKLIVDINEHGAKVRQESNTGVVNYKRNESIDQLVKINQQMLKMLQCLKIEACDPVPMEDGDDDEL